MIPVERKHVTQPRQCDQHPAGCGGTDGNKYEIIENKER